MFTMLGDVMPPLHEDTSPTMARTRIPRLVQGSEKSIEPRGRAKWTHHVIVYLIREQLSKADATLEGLILGDKGEASLSTLPRGEIRNGASRLVGSRY